MEKKRISLFTLNKNIANNIANSINTTDGINVKYTNDYDINNIDLLVKIGLDNEKKDIKSIENQISVLQTRINDNLELIDIYVIQNDIRKLKDRIDSINKEEKKMKYISLTRKILEKYNRNIGNKNLLVSDYLYIAKRYIKLNITKIDVVIHSCLNCGKEINIEEELDDNQVCSGCFMKLSNSISIKSYSKLSSTDDKKRISPDNFIKIVSYFKGDDNFRLTKQDFIALDNYFMRIYNLDEIKAGANSICTVKIMRKALKVIGKSTYFKNIHSIGNQYCNWLPNDISDIESEIYNVYETIQIWVNNNPAKGRNSSLNNQWLLYKICNHLSPGRFHINKFMIQSSSDSVIFHEKRWDEIIKSGILNRKNLPFSLGK